MFGDIHVKWGAILGLLGLATLATLVAIWCVRRHRRRLALVGAVLAAAAVSSAMVASQLPPPGYDQLDERAIALEGARIAKAAEIYRQRMGAWPPNLAAIQLAPPETPFGPMRYRVSTDKSGRDCLFLSVGDYGVHGFVTWWSSCAPEAGWHVDS